MIHLLYCITREHVATNTREVSQWTTFIIYVSFFLYVASLVYFDRSVKCINSNKKHLSEHLIRALSHST